MTTQGCWLSLFLYRTITTCHPAVKKTFLKNQERKANLALLMKDMIIYKENAWNLQISH